MANLVGHTGDEFSHLVCVFKDAGFFEPLVRASGHEVFELGVAGKHPWLAAAMKLRPVVKRFQPDLIKTWLFDANIVGRLVKTFSSRTPLVTTLHSLDYEPEVIRAANWSPRKVEVLRRIDETTARFAKPHFVGCSHYVKKSYQKRLNIPDRRIEVIYNGIDPLTLECAPHEPQNVRRELDIPNDAFVYVTIGRIDTMKNHALLLRAFPQVLSAVPQAYLTIVGAGLLEQKLKDLASALGIADRVRFTGRRKDVGACLEMADVFVFPTLLEGHPLALVEAMFKSLPSVSSNIEVLREVITDDDNGLLFDSNQPEALATAMIKLQRDPQLRERLGKQAFDDAQRRFHIHSIAAQWKICYKKLIGDKTPKQN